MNSRNISYVRTFWRIFKKTHVSWTIDRCHFMMIHNLINNFCIWPMFDWYTYEMPLRTSSSKKLNEKILLWQNLWSHQPNWKDVLRLWEQVCTLHIHSRFIERLRAQERWRYQWKWWFIQGLRDNIARLAPIQWLLELMGTHQCNMQDGWCVDGKHFFTVFLSP